MPMIDVYATAGTFADKHQLAADLAAAVMTIEQLPDIPMFRQNTAAFIHDLPAGSLSNVDGDSTYVRIQVRMAPGRVTAIIVKRAVRLLITVSWPPGRLRIRRGCPPARPA